MAGFNALGTSLLGSDSNLGDWQNLKGPSDYLKVSPTAYATGYLIDKLSGGSDLGQKMMGQGAAVPTPTAPTPQVPPISSMVPPIQPVTPISNTLPALATPSYTLDDNPAKTMLNRWSTYLTPQNGN